MKSLVLLIFVLTVSVCPPLKAFYPISLENSSDDSLKVLEKVYLHSDRDNYYPGDDIWFKAYLVGAADRKLSAYRSNLHVELISPDNKIIYERVVKLENGLGHGDFRLSENLKSGRYVLRAYTNYMRNFDDQLFFSKIITIYSLPDAERELAKGVQNVRDKFDLTFFPEGGSLTDSVTNIVAFKAENQTGIGCEITGEVRSSDGNIITIFNTAHKGMGTFSFVPVTGMTYYAIARNISGDTVRAKLPASFPSGIAMNVYRNKQNKLLVTLKTNKKTLAQIKNTDIELAAYAHNTEYMSLNIRMDSTDIYFVLPEDKLPAGIYSVTLKTAFGPLCERLLYKGNNDQVKLTLSTDKKLYNQRDSVSLKIALNDNTQLFGEAFLSLSSTRLIYSGTEAANTSSISSWFLLESDVRGQVEDAAWYFDPSNADRLKNLDLLLLTQGWRDFKWKYGFMKYLPENGFTISGELRKKFVNEPLKNSTINLGLFKIPNPLFVYIPCDKTGKFHIDSIDFTGKVRLMVSAMGENDRFQGILSLDSLKYSPEEPKKLIKDSKLSGKKYLRYSEIMENSLVEYDKMNAYIQYAEIKSSIASHYKLSDTIIPGEVNIIARRRTSTEASDAKIRYTLMTTPDATLIVSPEDNRYSTAFGLLRGRMSFDYRKIEIPIFVVDGNKVSAEIFGSVPIGFIERIDILSTRASMALFGPNTENPQHQDRAADGVFSITTRSGAPFYYGKKVYHSVNITISGYSEPRVFYSPKHHTSLQSDYKPDLRTTLFWKPDINVENNNETVLNYFNADNPSLVRITVEGITSEGIPLTGKLEYEVK